MIDSKTKFYRSELAKLNKFTNSKADFKPIEIFIWVSKCVSLFKTIGVPENIITGFITTFDTRNAGKPDSPIMAYGGHSTLSFPDGLIRSQYYYKIAFSTARIILDSYLEEKRLVPTWLIDILEDFELLRQLLLNIQRAYEEKNPNELSTTTNTLLDSILSTAGNLKKKDKLGGKLQAIIQSEDLQQFFGCSSDLIKGLDCSRILRNERLVHPTSTFRDDVPFAVATNYAFLVISFLEIFLSTGNLT